MVHNKNRSHRVNRSLLCKWIDTVCYQRNPKIIGFFFKVRSLFLHICKWRTIYRNSNNIILTSVPCMVIRKLRYVFSPEQLLQTWNDGNIMKNLLRHLFCYFICSISTYMTFQTFCCKFMLIIIYNMVIGACMNLMAFQSLSWWKINLDMCEVKYLMVVTKIQLASYKKIKNKLLL